MGLTLARKMLHGARVMRMNRPPRLARSAVATAAALLAAFVLLAQVVVCQCGLLCAHDGVPTVVPATVPPVTLAHTCCGESAPSDAPSPQQPAEPECPCEKQVIADLAPVADVILVTSSHTTSLPPAALAVAPCLSLEVVQQSSVSPPRAPTRAGPAPAEPLHILLDVFLI